MTDERTLVIGWRTRGYGWQTISNMTGRSIDNLRRNYDPGYAGVCPRPEPVKPAPPQSRRYRPKPTPNDSWDKLPCGERIRFVMDALYAAKLPVQMNDLGGYSGANTVLSLRARFGADIIGSKQNVGYWLTDKGREIYQQFFAKAEAA